MEPRLREAFSMIDGMRILELAKRLIEIPSVTGEELRVAHYAKEVLESSGLPVELRGSGERPIVLSNINP
ncbi:MAG: hypothetical protein QW639_04210, partial [Candidatus Bathyarchaeia archaeon]